MSSSVLHGDDFGGSWAVEFRGEVVPIRYRTQDEALAVLRGLLAGPQQPLPLGRASAGVRGNIAKHARARALQLSADRAAAYGLA